MASDPGTIELERNLPAPPGEVWAALTDPALHARWWAAGDVRPVVGHFFLLDMGPWGPQSCEVLAVEPQRLFRYTFAPGTLGTTITWRLAPEGAGTRLQLEHAGFDLATPAGQAAFQGMGAGWPGVLDRLARLLATPA